MPDNTNGHEPELLTIAEAAELLRAPVATLRYWRHCNIGPRSFRLGRRVLYRREDLRAWIDVQHRQDNSAGARQEGHGDRAVVSPRRKAARQ
jgi:excisionase family DNA binding protein